jgi:hypothetical protein
MMSELDQDAERIQKALDTLSEHFDTCAIFCTRHDSGGSGGTIRICQRVGNYYAIYGQVHDWIIRNEEQAREEAREEM